MKKLKELLKRRSVRFVALAVSGLLTGATVCFPALGLLEWFSLIPAALVLYSVADNRKNRLRSVYLHGLFFFMCYFVMTWHWFYVMYPMSYTGMSPFAVITVLAAAMLGLPLLQASSFAFVFVLAVLIIRGALTKKHAIFAPFAAAALWVILEWSETLFWFGVPWGRLSIGQTGILVNIQTASWFGCYFITFLIVAVNFLLAYAFYNTEAKKLFTVTAAAIFAFNTLSGAVLITADRPAKTTVRAAVIQGNISSADKWDDSGWFSLTSEAYSRLTREAAAQGAKIVVWPETVLPTYIESSPQSMKLITGLAAELDIILLVGTISRGDTDGQYNTVLTVMPDGTVNSAGYFKQKLVPFGEYVPWRDFITALIPALGEVNMLSEDFNAGTVSTVAETEYGKIGSLVCFDSIYEELARESAANGAGIIAIETNDSWFYDSPAVHMHLAQAKLRAVENGRYVLRSANTGISAVIRPDGSVVCEKEALIEGYCVADVEFRTRRTLYTITGNLIVWLSCAAVVGIIAADVTVRIRNRKKEDKA